MCAASVRGKIFFEPLEHALVLSRVLRAAADVGERKPPEQVGDGALAVDHAKALFDCPPQVDPPPAHDAVDRRIGACLDDLGQLAHLNLRQPPRTAGARTVRQAIRPRRIEAVRPIPERLAVHAADLCGVRPAHAVIDGRQRQKPTDLAGIPAALGQFAEPDGIIVVSKLNTRWHGESPSPPLNQIGRRKEIPRESEFHAPGIS